MWDQLRQSNSSQQTQESQSLGKASFVQQILLFLNTYLMLQEGSKAAVFAVNGSGRSENYFLDDVEHRVSILRLRLLYLLCSHLLHLSSAFLGNQAKPKQHSAHSVAEEVLQQLMHSMTSDGDVSGQSLHLNAQHACTDCSAALVFYLF